MALLVFLDELHVAMSPVLTTFRQLSLYPVFVSEAGFNGIAD
jgi:hypothetical protein